MATYFVASGGSNTAPYDTWAKAATSLQTALTAASTAGDVVVIQYNAVPSGDAEVSADVTYTFAESISLISASNDGGSSYTPTVMGTANWIGHSTANRSVTFSGADFSPYIYGITVRNAGSTTDSLTLSNSAGQCPHFHSCYFWLGNSNANATINLAAGMTNHFTAMDCTFRFGATGQGFSTLGKSVIIGGSISSSGSTPTVLFKASSAPALTYCVGFDMSLVTGTLVPNTGAVASYVFDRCKLGSGVTVMAAQTTNPTLASAEVLVLDCHSGDTHGMFGYHNALGSVTSDTGIYFTSGDAGQSWKIVTTSNASDRMPFVTPWIDVFHNGTSAITPYLEILRDGSTTAYTDTVVYAEFGYKGTSGVVTASFKNDKGTGSDQAAGAGTGSWTGEGGSAWSGKIDSGTSLTPAESGSLTARVFCAGASATFYVDPQIRGLS